MKRVLAAIGFFCSALPAGAGGIDMTGQPISFIFREGTVAEIGVGMAFPSTTGRDAALFGGGKSGNITDYEFLPSLSFKFDATDWLSFGLSYEQPFGAAVEYGPSSFALAGTDADADVSTLTGLVRVKLGDRFSVHGGGRLQTAKANFRLTGALYGPISGYGASLARDTSAGFLIGAAYEIPEYFIRVAVTYNSAIEHTLSTVETLRGGVINTMPTTAETPQSINLEFTSGIAENTFIFGGARWVEWSKLRFDPAFLLATAGEGLVDFNDTFTFNLGVGRKMDDNWVLLGSLIYEPSTGVNATPLTPVDGFFGASLGAVYSVGNIEVHGNLTALALGETSPFVRALGTSVVTFDNNYSIAGGIKFVYKF